MADLCHHTFKYKMYLYMTFTNSLLKYIIVSYWLKTIHASCRCIVYFNGLANNKA